MLTIHRSERADQLVRALADVLAVPPPDPFIPDVVAVPSRGVERWISQSLSTRLGAGRAGGDGVCANLQFPSPGRLVSEVVARAGGVEPDEDPWAARRLTWPLLDVIDACSTEPWCVTLGRHVGAVGEDDLDHRRGRRAAVARKLAALFASYSAQRPALVRSWVAGDDGDVPSDVAWQAELYRRLRARIGTPAPAERLEAACAALRNDPDVVALPQRLSIFGPTRITVEQLCVVDALAAHRDVHLWLPHPSYGLWDRLEAQLGSNGSVQVARAEDPTADLPRHPLLASLGRDTRELQLMLAEHTQPGADLHHATDDPEPPENSLPVTLLSTLQDQLHHDSPPAGDHVLDVRDRSVQVHACHGRLRQVEVMREVVLGLLADDPTLELRDIVVMCPDIEAYAPLISATFGLVTEEPGESHESHPAHRLRVRLADRSLRQTNPVLDVLSRLLDLADARVTASEVLDLAAAAPVRRRFRFDDDELERLADWVGRAGVRWGLDADARAPYQLDGVPQNTWQAGLDRLLLGVAMDEEDLRTFGGVLPLDDVDSGEIDLAGRLAELVDRLSCVVEALRPERPLQDWVAALGDALDALVDVPHRDGWQLTQARSQLHEVVESAGERGSTVPLTLPEVRALLADLLRGRPTRSSFRTGHLTMCSMVPMRAVPHRVVVLLGLDDETFPRQGSSDGDDLLARTPRVGEHDLRSEDRQLFLDAILAAGDTLVILYTGQDQRTGATRPPAVPVGELLDVLDRTAHVEEGEVRDRVVVRHPLQGFDPRNFQPGALVPSEAFSFDAVGALGGRALTRPRLARPAFVPTPLDQPEREVVHLADLVAFVQSPVAAFLRQRLDIALHGDEETAADAISVGLEGLESWKVGNRLLAAALRGADRGAVVTAELLRGEVPPGALGRAELTRVLERVDALVSGSSGLRSGGEQRIEVDVPLGDGRSLRGQVPAVYGDRVVRIEYSKLAPKHRLVSWLHLLALTAHDPARPWEVIVAGRGDREGTARAWAGPVDADTAREHLQGLVDLHLQGLRSPLPISEKATSVYAERRFKGEGHRAAELAARREWDGRYGDRTQAAHRLVWGEAEFEALLVERSEDPDDPSLFGSLARQLWQPLLEREGTAWS